MTIPVLTLTELSDDSEDNPSVNACTHRERKVAVGAAVRRVMPSIPWLIDAKAPYDDFIVHICAEKMV